MSCGRKGAGVSSKPRIIVFQLKELIYTAIFVILGILLVLLLIFMFLPKGSEDADAVKYVAGTYTSSTIINSIPMEVAVTVDSDHINSIELINVSSAIETMYPLISPSMEDIEKQILDSQDLSNIQYNDENKFTYLVLISAINSALDKASAD